MENKVGAMDPETKAKYALAMAIGGGTTPESINLVRDLAKSYPSKDDASAFLSECGYQAEEIKRIIEKAFEK